MTTNTSLNNSFYFVATQLLILISAAIFFEGFTRNGIAIIIICLLVLWSFYKEFYVSSDSNSKVEKL
jgi:hypothetical protein